MGRGTMLRGFPDYPKDADAALAALPYNSSSQALCGGGSYSTETTQDD